jgi:hypothetical protein
MVPSSCQGDVLADNNGKCQDMLSFNIVAACRSKDSSTPAVSMSLGISSKTVSGVVLIIATVTLFNSFPPSLLSHLTHLIINVSDKLKDIFFWGHG